jgi:ankyrin repeat protein
MMLAANHGYPPGDRIVALLLQHGANIRARDIHGATALHWAESFVYKEPYGVGAHAITAALIQNGADANAKDSEGSTPLMQAARRGGHDDPSFLEELLSAGADLHARNNDGATILMLEAESGHVAMVKFLLARGAKVDAKDNKGRTALDYAADYTDRKGNDYQPGCIGSSFGSCEGVRRVLDEALHAAKRGR